jgi:hypothetical protein
MGQLIQKQPLVRTRKNWEDNIKLNLTEVGFKGERWLELAQYYIKCSALVLMVFYTQKVNLWDFLIWLRLGSTGKLWQKQ